jgi:hypothetical protein
MSNLTLHLDDALVAKLSARAGERDLAEAIEAWLTELAGSAELWDAWEREANEDIRQGRVTTYANADEFIASLERDFNHE